MAEPIEFSTEPLQEPVASCDHDDIAIISHNEKRLGGRGSLQPLPIELNPLGLEPELGGKLDEA